MAEPDHIALLARKDNSTHPELAAAVALAAQQPKLLNQDGKSWLQPKPNVQATASDLMERKKLLSG